MEIDRQIAEHYAVVRRVMSDAAMNPLGPQATINQPENFTRVGATYIPTPEREALHERWINEVIQESAVKAEIGSNRHAVVMAGAPGMGKGTIQREQFNDLPGFVACDPDRFKEKIIEHELRQGTLDALDTPLMAELKAQGHEFAPMEYSTLVHQESSLVSRQLQQQLQREGKNFIIDTVLKDVESARGVMARLDDQNYTYDVVSVQGTAAESKAGIYGRWESAHRSYLEGKNELGGRPVPSEFANSTFPDSSGPSTTQEAAQWLAENGKGAFRFQQYRRGAEGPEIDLVKEQGKLVPSNQERSSERAPTTTPEMKSGVTAGQVFDVDFPRATGFKSPRVTPEKPYSAPPSAPPNDRGLGR